jgi:L-histidine N-alpha-methyltransferase
MDAILTATTETRKNFRKALHSSGTIIKQEMSDGEGLPDFATSIMRGLSANPRSLESRFLYDARGSRLFDEITRQPEYYLTRTEAGILARQSHLIRKICGPTTLVELGSGSSEKTFHLLRAWLGQGLSAQYIPVDVSESALADASQRIAASHPNARVIGINADYSSAFPLFREVSPVTVLFLGSTIGNFADRDMVEFLTMLARALSRGDFFLLGIDLVKDRKVIEAAYNDAAGITAEFTRNLFVRMNRELGSGIDTSAVEHVAVYNDGKTQVEISARFTRRQAICIPQADRSFVIDAGEEIRTEISRKFHLDFFLGYAELFGFSVEEVFTDDREWFALLLLRRTGTTPAPETES